MTARVAGGFTHVVGGCSQPFGVLSEPGILEYIGRQCTYQCFSVFLSRLRICLHQRVPVGIGILVAQGPGVLHCGELGLPLRHVKRLGLYFGLCEILLSGIGAFHSQSRPCRYTCLHEAPDVVV